MFNKITPKINLIKATILCSGILTTMISNISALAQEKKDIVNVTAAKATETTINLTSNTATIAGVGIAVIDIIVLTLLIIGCFIFTIRTWTDLMASAKDGLNKVEIGKALLTLGKILLGSLIITASLRTFWTTDIGTLIVNRIGKILYSAISLAL